MVSEQSYRPELPRAAVAFNVFNAETLLGVAAAMRQSGLPAILQTSSSTVKAYGAGCLAGMVAALLGPELRRRTVLHLDHCDTDSLFLECLEAGWDSVMIDASARPLEENIRRTRSVVLLAHSFGALVEGEIGVVGGDEDGFEVYAGDAGRTALEDVLQFIDGTGVDLVAVGVGTKHGHYETPVNIDQTLLEAVHTARPGAALVLHGGSGIPESQLRDAVLRGGIRKVNISTEIKDAWLSAVQAHLDSSDPHKVIAAVKLAESAVCKAARNRMEQIASFLS